MCGPEAMFGMQTGAQLGMAALGGEQDYADYGKKVRAIQQEADAINKSTIFKYRMTQLQKQQIEDRAAAEVGQLKLKTTEAQGTVLASAATGGIEGNSVEALMQAFGVSTGRDIMFTHQEADNAKTQVTMEEKGINMDAFNRKQGLINQLPDDPTAKVISRFIGAAFGAGESYMKNTTKTKDGGGLFGRRFG